MIYGFEDLFSVMHYPAGESHVELVKRPSDRVVYIIAGRVNNFESLMNCVTGHRILVRQGFAPEWFIPYFPFGRHDRRIDKNDGLELGLAMEMAAELNPVTLDPHSDVLGQMRHIPQAEVVKLWEDKGMFPNGDVVFVIPDAGATKKAFTWLNGRPAVQGFKHRDMRTGKLSGFGLAPSAENFLLKGTNCVIVDDICDGGGTFLGLADVLKDYGVDTLTLAVTHGLFTQGTNHLFEKFDNIVSTGFHRSDWVRRLKYSDIFTRGGKV